MLTKKQKGYLAETLVSNYFVEQGFALVVKNYTIRGGEIDLVLKNDLTWLFVEVKEVFGVDDIMDYIPPKKLQTLQKTIHRFFLDYKQGNLGQQLIVVYTKGNHIYQLYYYEG